VRIAGGPALAALAALLLAAMGTGCGGPGPSAASPIAVSGSTAPASATPAVTPGPSPSLGPNPTATAGQTGSAPGSPSSPGAASSSPSIAPGAVEDPALIAVLPASIAGNPVTLESEAFAEALADPGFVTNIETAAFGIVVTDNDLASAVVARPVDGVFSDAWFRAWRDSYNQGACAQSGGVAGNAEAELGGRTVYIGTCTGGLRTYHTWLVDRGLLISAFSIGESRFGEQLMTGLRP
jgi:hypothetical protein